MASPDLYQGKITPFIDAELIARRVAELAEQIDREMGHEKLVMAVVLKSGFIFASDLIRAMRTPVRMAFVTRRRGGKKKPHVCAEDEKLFAGHHVILVETLLGRGSGEREIVKRIEGCGPASLSIAVLLHRTVSGAETLPVRFLGFEVPTVRLIGYGLDENQRLRGLSEIYAWKADIDPERLMAE